MNKHMPPMVSRGRPTLARQLVAAQDKERARIARELHDDVSQQLALLEDEILKLVAELPESATPLIDPVVQRARTITRSVHELSHRLHPARLRLLGLIPAIKGLAADLSRALGVDITVIDDGTPATLPPQVRVGVFRVVQEALHNAGKYSGASHIRVRARADAAHLRVTVEDDGVGFDVNTAWDRGLGLISMSERMESVGGSLDIQSVPGRNTRVDLVVPLRASAIAV
jgi:signal transduction histidine kinase